MAFATEYDSVWGEMYQKRLELLGKRAGLEAELTDVKKQIVHLNEILSHLGPLAGIAHDQDFSSMGITDAIRWVLNDSEERMTAAEVRDKLVEKGYDMSSLTAPMASIYKVLSRLSSEPNQEITREKTEDGKVYYQWTKRGDDIPF